MSRRMIDPDGTVQAWSYNPMLAVALSVVIGFLSSLLGIGGGFILVPVMVNFLNFPVHVASATSHFTLTVMTLVGSIVHLRGARSRAPPGGWCRSPWGWRLERRWGPAMAQRMQGAWIIRALVLALAFVGARLVIKAL